MTTNTVKGVIFASLIAVMVIPFAMDNAFAFEPTQKEQRVIEKYAITTQKVEELCSSDTNRAPSCDKLEQKQMRLMFKLNDLGIFLDGQEPSLSHLTDEYSSTRAAAQAGVQPVEEKETVTTSAASACSTCDDPKTMYVKAAYKDSYFWWGIKLWEHYAGNDSTDISTGQTTSADFKPRWSGTNSGLIPYCQTSSVSLPADASYTLSTLVKTTSGVTLITSSNAYDSEFRWYDPHDQIGDKEINNLASGMDIHCNLSSVTVS